jgi:recA bacterial DNA recombination protein
MANMDRLPFSSSLLASPKRRPSSPPSASRRCRYNGLPRGGITEIAGLRSSGRTAAVLHILAQATARGEICALVDTCDAFHPASAAAAGVKLARIVFAESVSPMKPGPRLAGESAHFPSLSTREQRETLEYHCNSRERFRNGLAMPKYLTAGGSR